MGLIKKDTKIKFTENEWLLALFPLFNDTARKWRSSHSTRSLRVYIEKLNTYAYLYLIMPEEVMPLINKINKDKSDQFAKLKIYKLPEDKSLSIDCSYHEYKKFVENNDKKISITELEKYEL